MSKVYGTVNQFVGHGGQSVWIGVGDEFDGSEEIVKSHPEMFTKEEASPAKLSPAARARLGRQTS
jgi:hypothetical protein